LKTLFILPQSSEKTFKYINCRYFKTILLFFRYNKRLKLWLINEIFPEILSYVPLTGAQTMPGNLRKKLGNLLGTQYFAVLCTQPANKPYCSLVAFSNADNFAALYFVTSRHSRKYHNIMSNAAISMLLDNRANKPEDISSATAVTAIGHAREIRGRERHDCVAPFLAKHPSLGEFIAEPNSAFIKIEVECYIVVESFQNITEWRPPF